MAWERKRDARLGVGAPCLTHGHRGFATTMNTTMRLGPHHSKSDSTCFDAPASKDIAETLKGAHLVVHVRTEHERMPRASR